VRPPGATVAGPVFPIARSATSGDTTVVSVQEGCSSGLRMVLTLAACAQLSISVPAARAASARTVNVKVLVSLTASEPAVQLTVPSLAVHPAGSAVTATRSTGSGSE